MIVFRRRLIFWLIRAYFRKWSKTILLFFVIGLLGFFALKYFLDIVPYAFPFLSKQTVGFTGSYTIDDMPSSILSKVSRGLTKVSDDGKIAPDIASSWKIEDDGRRYAFFLKKNLYFTDGAHLTSKEINYNFRDAVIEKPNDYEIVFKLKDAYSPFLITVSRPIFKKGFVGLGSYKVNDLKLNGNFISSIELSSKDQDPKNIKYTFFPTEDSLKTSFTLGETSQILGIHNLVFKEKAFSVFNSVKTQKTLNQRQLVTIFYNTADPVLSDKKVREALSLAVTDSFTQGLRNYGPFSPSSWAKSEIGIYTQDIPRAKELLTSSSASESSQLKFTLKTLTQYKDTATILKENFNKIGVRVQIEEIQTVPDNFQMFLGDFNLSKDPDQYMLWHSDQNTNITNYKNLRIDKLLEDGRKISDLNERKKIYSDFQKYLLDDSPATFLYLPYVYDVSRN
ncbi:MAG: ABC transporter substrate-binding protein [Patescibacteria group bacterium]